MENYFMDSTSSGGRGMNYPKPSWRPIRTESPDWFIDRIAHYTNRQKSFVLYSHGTVVFQDSESSDYIIRCDGALNEVVTHAPDFTVRPMNYGDSAFN